MIKIDEKLPVRNVLRLPANFSIMLFQLRQETCTAASVHLADIIFIPLIVYYAYVAI
jgi:hypothetical protein